ncbi:hypothetical protein FBU59_006851 [Linderina macrospora]|uniref:Uncharacterized protein n=1 Tax=Linderina macrospora TaxID=4868 RepID=A0ACC1IYX3_9FUNG|nr:hypothetical protein FBU59_006851 [Linderina macrospora]
MATERKVHWVPLESNPEVINAMISRLGVSPSFGFNDVWGLDDELLGMVAQPVKAVIFLFPLTDKSESTRAQKVASATNTVSPNVWFMRQTIGNACGTMAVIHALANNQADIPIEGHLAEFFAKTKTLSPEERAELLENDEVIAGTHSEGASGGQTAAPDAEAAIDLHFIAFVNVDGDMYELDGRHAAPINHGVSTDLLKVMYWLDAAGVIKQRIRELDGGSLEFTVLALGPHPNMQF